MYVIFDGQFSNKKCIDSYKKSNYWLSLSLLLTEWEFVSRLLFAIVNDCKNRVQTAESDELYITFDEILSQTLGEGENQFPKIIGNWHMELLLDLLVLPEGPRIRDKVSHGEIDSNDLHSKKSIQIVAVSYLAINTILGSLEKSSALVENNPTHSIAVTNYSSQYHPTSLLLKDIHIAVISVKSVLLKHLHSGTTLNELRLKDAECLVMFMKDHSFMMRMEPLLGKLIEFGEGTDQKKKKGVVDCIKFLSELFWTMFPEHHESFLARYKTKKHELKEVNLVTASTLYREKREYELWSICRKIIFNINLIISNIDQNVQDKKLQFDGKNLRSRQRNTYKRMMMTIPPIIVTCVSLLILILTHLIDFYTNKIVSIEENCYMQLLKRSKRFLKICENIKENARKDKNRWEESNQLIKDFAKHINNLHIHN